MSDGKFIVNIGNGNYKKTDSVFEYAFYNADSFDGFGYTVLIACIVTSILIFLFYGFCKACEYFC